MSVGRRLLLIVAGLGLATGCSPRTAAFNLFHPAAIGGELPGGVRVYEAQPVEDDPHAAALVVSGPGGHGRFHLTVTTERWRAPVRTGTLGIIPAASLAGIGPGGQTAEMLRILAGYWASIEQPGWSGGRLQLRDMGGGLMTVALEPAGGVAPGVFRTLLPLVLLLLLLWSESRAIRPAAAAGLLLLAGLETLPHLSGAQVAGRAAHALLEVIDGRSGWIVGAAPVFRWWIERLSEATASLPEGAPALLFSLTGAAGLLFPVRSAELGRAGAIAAACLLGLPFFHRYAAASDPLPLFWFLLPLGLWSFRQVSRPEGGRPVDLALLTVVNAAMAGSHPYGFSVALAGLFGTLLAVRRGRDGRPVAASMFVAMVAVLPFLLEAGRAALAGSGRSADPLGSLLSVLRLVLPTEAGLVALPFALAGGWSLARRALNEPESGMVLALPVVTTAIHLLLADRLGLPDRDLLLILPAICLLLGEGAVFLAVRAASLHAGILRAGGDSRALVGLYLGLAAGLLVIAPGSGGLPLLDVPPAERYRPAAVELVRPLAQAGPGGVALVESARTGLLLVHSLQAPAGGGCPAGFGDRNWCVGGLVVSAFRDPAAPVQGWEVHAAEVVSGLAGPFWYVQDDGERNPSSEAVIDPYCRLRLMRPPLALYQCDRTRLYRVDSERFEDDFD